MGYEALSGEILYRLDWKAYLILYMQMYLLLYLALLECSYNQGITCEYSHDIEADCFRVIRTVLLMSLIRCKYLDRQPYTNSGDTR